MFPGTKIMIGGKEYTMPTISLGQLRNGMLQRLNDHDKALEEGKIFDMTLIRGEVLLEVFRRNYPDFEADIFFADIDMGNIGPLWLKVLGMSGFTPGEETAAAETNSSGISGPSTEA